MNAVNPYYSESGTSLELASTDSTLVVPTRAAVFGYPASQAASATSEATLSSLWDRHQLWTQTALAPRGVECISYECTPIQGYLDTQTGAAKTTAAGTGDDVAALAALLASDASLLSGVRMVGDVDRPSCYACHMEGKTAGCIDKWQTAIDAKYGGQAAATTAASTAADVLAAAMGAVHVSVA